MPDVRPHLAVLLACLIAAGCGSNGLDATPSSHQHRGTGTACAGTKATITHVVVLMEENHSYSQVAGQMPYLDSLAAQCGLATNLKAVTHPSLGNYMALTSGHAYFAGTDCSPSSTCQTSAQSIFGQLGSGWRVYAQTMPSNCDLSNSGAYVVRHTAAPYYTAVRTACKTQDVPIGQLNPASLPRFAWIAPDVNHDMHSASVGAADTYAQTILTPIINSAAYQAGSVAIFVTFDEGSGSDQTVWTLVAARGMRVGKNTQAWTHYSLLRSWQDLLGVGCLQASCNAPGLRTAFGL